MRCVEPVVADPVRRVPGKQRWLDQPADDRLKLRQQRIAKAASPPLDAHDLGVLGEAELVALPHADGGMIPPSRERVAAMRANVDAEREENLLALDTLLAEPLRVKARCGVAERRVGQEGLNGVTRCLY